MTKLTKRDINHLRDELRGMWSDEDRHNEGGSDVVMTSIGYVDLWTDGEVSAYGRVIGKFDDDLDWTEDTDDESDDGSEE